MGLEKRNQQIQDTRMLLLAELKRITSILQSDIKIGYGYDNAELKNKMLESRRDMIRLEKLMYDYNLKEE